MNPALSLPLKLEEQPVHFRGLSCGQAVVLALEFCHRDRAGQRLDYETSGDHK